LGSRRWAQSLRLGGTALAILFCLGAILFLGLDVRSRLQALERANSDNTQWVMMQTEVEVLRLHAAVLNAMDVSDPTLDPALQPDALNEVRRWFNVLYSRVTMLQESAIYAPLLALPEYSEDHGLLRGYLDSHVALIDENDAVLSTGLDRIEAPLAEVRTAARDMTLNALSDFAAQSDMNRESISQTLVRLALLTATLLALVTGFAVVMARLYRQAEAQSEEVRLAGARLSTIVSTSADGIVVTDTNALIREFNPAAEAMFGMRRDQVLGRSALQMLFANDRLQQDALLQVLRTPTSGKDPIRIEVDARRADGSEFPAEVSIARSRPRDGSLIVAYLRDISDRRRAERDLTDALDRALAGEKTKADFMAVMSHEMRTPLNGLIGSMHLMRQTPLDPAQAELMGIMETSGGMLLDHVNSVLDIARAEAGAIPLLRAGFDLDALVEEVVANQAGLARASGNAISVAQVTGPIGMVLGDRGRIRQILLNLIGNAVKFTNDGQIIIETERMTPSATEAGMVELRVIDTGIGISDANLERIFEDFVTLDTSYGRETGGTGLGLSIARRLAEAMGGEVGAESVEGEGSLFWLRLPLPATDMAPPQTAAQMAQAVVPDAGVDDPALLTTGLPVGPPKSVLVVEDNQINRFLVRRYLELGGHQVTEARDGIDGVEQAARLRFDVILMDISMPRMDGMEAARRIRAGGGPSAEARILALTAHALPDEQKAFRQAGMEATLTKPIGRNDLLLAIAGQVPMAGPPDDSDASVVDGARLAELVQTIGPRMALSLLDRLTDEAEITVTRLMALPLDSEGAEVARLCHQLAGTSGTFGTRRLRSVLVAVEAAVRVGDQDGAAGHMAELPAVWSATRRVLRAELARLQDAA
jgi:PAS domain S-box-containing protein